MQPDSESLMAYRSASLVYAGLDYKETMFHIRWEVKNGTTGGPLISRVCHSMFMPALTWRNTYMRMCTLIHTHMHPIQMAQTHAYETERHRTELSIATLKEQAKIFHNICNNQNFPDIQQRQQANM